MLVKVVDSWRNVSHSAQPGLENENPLAVLARMTAAYAGNPHVEVRCDKEFYDALINAEGSEDGIVPAYKSSRSSFEGEKLVPRPTYKGFPIVVEA